MKTILRSHMLLLLILPFIGFAQQVTSRDSDGDGIPDSTDKCMLSKGTGQFKGCPYPQKITAYDRDGDGIKDVYDQCPDMFGPADNKGCPTLTRSGSLGQTLASHNSLFSTVSSVSSEKDESFKQSLTTLIGEAGHSFSTVKKELYTNDPSRFKTSVCFPGANECYLRTDTKTWYADYGKYSDEAAAADKYYALKQKLNELLGENEWNKVETSNQGYINSYRMTKRNAGANAPVITTHVDRVNNAYNVYITVEEK